MAFAVIDFETTGLVPERSDRVVEVAVVLVDHDGRVESEWATLVNPRRDVGATRIHGISAADLLDAPEFNAIGDEILRLVEGRTVVAHNATFDMRFLYSELVRAGYSIHNRPPALCSMKWSGVLIGPAKLEHACSALGILVDEAHTALGDARATATLLSHLMYGASRDHTATWREDVEQSRRFAWPQRCGRGNASPVRRGGRCETANDWLATVLKASWVPGVPEDEASYLLVLERALLDRVVSRTEARELVEAASGLTGATVARLHRDYLRAMAQEAWSDGIVTEQERAELLSIAHTLGLTAADVNAALASATESHAKSQRPFSLSRGDRVVFTGEMLRPRDEWVALIAAAGLASGGVTKSTRVVVAADPDSMSGKAAKARQYGVPVISEDAFERLFSAYRAALAL